jgi:hypothetical protein
MSSASLYSTGSAHYASSQGDQGVDVADGDNTEPSTLQDSAVTVRTLAEAAPQCKPDVTYTVASSASTTTGATDYDALFLSHTASAEASAAVDPPNAKKRKLSADTADNEGEGTSTIRSSKTSKAPTGVIKLKASKEKATGNGSGTAGTEKAGKEVKKVKKSGKKSGKKGGGVPADDIDDIFGGL